MDNFKEKMQAGVPNDLMQQQFDGIFGEQAVGRVRQEMSAFFEAENDTLNRDDEYMQLLSHLIINLDKPDSRNALEGLGR